MVTKKLICAVESYSACEAELREIYPLHWQELNVAADIALDPDYAAYRALDDLGRVFLTTLRDGPRLAGYFIGMLFSELHYRGCFTCFGDIFYILPEYRKQMAGAQLFRGAEAGLRERGVRRWYVASKLHRDCGALLRRAGFSPVEMHYSKRLD